MHAPELPVAGLGIFAQGLRAHGFLFLRFFAPPPLYPLALVEIDFHCLNQRISTTPKNAASFQ